MTPILTFTSLRNPFPAKAGQQLFRLGSTAALVIAITFVCIRLINVNATTVGFVYLVAILFVATGWGLSEAIVASLLAVALFNFFFLPPIGTFTIADPQNWVALFAFLATAIVASQLSSNAKQRAQQALERQLEMERLYALSHALLLLDPSRPAALQIARHVARIYDSRAVALFDRGSGETYRSGPEDMEAIDEKLQQAVLQGTFSADELTGTTVTPIRLGGEPIGSLAIRGAFLPDTALQALANLVAISLEKERAQEATSRAEAARQSEEFKSTLLDAVAHEFKTPLTSIKAAATALLSAPAANPEETRELLTVVNEEVDHLGRLVTEATQTARIEAGKMGLSMGLHSIDELVSAALAEMKSTIEGRSVVLNLPADLPTVFVDGELMVRVIRQLVDNAVKYSPPASPISIEAKKESGTVTLAVVDQGPGIRAAEQERVFEKFYRSPTNGPRMPGSGMGLSIAHEIVRAHGGRIWVESSPGTGSRFCVSIPTGSEAPTP